jgi:Na+-driven multidrug efflux pump
MVYNSRKILAFNGLVMIGIGITFIFFSQKLTLLIFPQTISNPDALQVGVICKVIMGMFSIFIGLILYLAHKSIRSTGQRLLLVSSFGFFLMFCTFLYIFFNNKGVVPIIGLIIFSLLAFLSFYVSTRNYQE